ncbi:hypothetical protein, partial [Huaxiibacter chinensis]|uniref:hypothetical protein n=1 Tax=Huaxiibacter chinensis TaxID=2899785 RepID=UPI003D31D387
KKGLQSGPGLLNLETVEIDTVNPGMRTVNSSAMASIIACEKKVVRSFSLTLPLSQRERE